MGLLRNEISEYLCVYSNCSYFAFCSFVKYSLQQTQEYLKLETFPVSELNDQVSRERGGRSWGGTRKRKIRFLFLID